MSNSLATYTITISADLPVDDQPETMFNWREGSPGHAFLTLTKSNPSEIVSQNLGFYPNTSWKSIITSDVNSKVVDDSDHEFQASYAVSVTGYQFQVALDKIAAIQSKKYNLGNYNCTDFVLEVFNTVQPSFTVPPHIVPNLSYSAIQTANTPQGLFDRISQLQTAGTSGASASSSKNYSTISHGPCN